MPSPTTLQLIGAALFAVALVHTFSTRIFERLAHAQPVHAGLWHLLGEVEIVFGFWAMVLVLVTFAIDGREAAIGYLEGRNFTEPMFVFVIMVVAGTRPVLGFARSVIGQLARLLPLPEVTAVFWLTLALVPLLGSFITEPAAMTLAALMLRSRYFAPGASQRLKYATLGVLFVNVSIGGTLTSFAAPPVLMVASAWGWDNAFMLGTLGWRAALAVAVNATAVTLLFGRELAGLAAAPAGEAVAPAPLPVVAVHLLFLAGVVVFAHHPVVFMGLFLFFMGYTTAYARHQERLILREGLLVAFFLAGLVVLGGQQQWWLQPVLTSLSAEQVYYGATALTAITDNAALTYLGSLVQGLSDEFKVALVAGAVTGGGLTIIANAPNPAAVSILRERFEHQTVAPLPLLLAAALPTLVAICAFRFL
ncbi:putative Na+/H+ antiporter [Derxia lacustris]|uniref:putative Na+/H+ antiporter n=1 Tax=Derxia lacustris TaxID=764842 RepID=UPI000A16E859|nr:putative Na+/H+ antiporter [Derxia lacustris]